MTALGEAAGPDTAGRGTANRAAVREQSGSPSNTADWPAKATDLLDSAVGALRDHSVKPLSTVARVVAFSFLGLAMLVVLVATLAVAIIRILDVYAFPHHVWLSYVVVGGIFALAGLLVFSVMRPR